MWIVNLATNRRHVTIVLRKRELCRCACKGWCTIYGALDCLKWQLAYLARGELPPTRHDGAPWVDGVVQTIFTRAGLRVESCGGYGQSRLG